MKNGMASSDTLEPLSSTFIGTTHRVSAKPAVTSAVTIATPMAIAIGMRSSTSAMNAPNRARAVIRAPPRRPAGTARARGGDPAPTATDGSARTSLTMRSAKCAATSARETNSGIESQ